MAFSPRAYQVEAVDSVLREFENHQSTLLLMATGTGKTVCIGRLVEHWKQYPGRVLLLAHRDELIQQASKTLKSMCPDDQIEIEHSGSEMRATRAAHKNQSMWGGVGRIVVASKDTLTRNIPKVDKKRSEAEGKTVYEPWKGMVPPFAPDEFSLVVTDECVSGDTIISTDKGDIPIKSVKTSGCNVVMSYNGYDKVWSNIIGFYPMGTKPILKFRFQSGATLRCTANHPIYTSRGWVRADEIVKGEVVLSDANAVAEKSLEKTSGEDNSDLCLAIKSKVEATKNGESCLRRRYQNPLCAHVVARNERRCRQAHGRFSRSCEATQNTPSSSMAMTRGRQIGICIRRQKKEWQYLGRCLETAVCFTRTTEAKIQDCHAITQPANQSGHCTKQRFSGDFCRWSGESKTEVTGKGLSRGQRDVCRVLEESTTSVMSEEKKELHGNGSIQSERLDWHGGSAMMGRFLETDFRLTCKDSQRAKSNWPQDGSEKNTETQKSTKREEDISRYMCQSRRGESTSMLLPGICRNQCNTSCDQVIDIDDDGTEDVYDISVEGTHCFFANGILVHNCHHAVAQTYRKIYDYFNTAKHLGVTATSDRTDEQALGQVFESVAYIYDILQAVEDGFLVRPVQQYVTVQDYDLSQIKVNRKSGDFDDADLDKFLGQEKILQGMVVPMMELANSGGQRRPVIGFANSVKQAKDLAAVANHRQPNSAAYISCDDVTIDERRYILQEYKAGNIQYLFNFGVLVEGTDLPNTRCIFMARPTKSRLVYAQAAGRGLRPHTTITDLLNAAANSEERRAIIAASEKPSCLIIDCVGVTGTHKLICSMADVLGGWYADEVVELAKEEAAKRGGRGDVVKDLEAAKKTYAERQQAERKVKVNIGVQFSTRSVDPFDLQDRQIMEEPRWARGKVPTEKQLDLLRKWKVPEQDLPKSFWDASKLIEKMIGRRKSGLCTYGQAKVLRKHGFDPEKMTFDAASKQIDAIAKSGWQLRGDTKQ